MIKDAVRRGCIVFVATLPPQRASGVNAFGAPVRRGAERADPQDRARRRRDAGRRLPAARPLAGRPGRPAPDRSRLRPPRRDLRRRHPPGLRDAAANLARCRGYNRAVEDLTTGSLSRHLLRTASFMLVTMLSQTLYLLVDLYWVGSLGKEAVAAVGIAGNLTFVVLACTQVLGVGTTTLIAHASGRAGTARAPATSSTSRSGSPRSSAALFLVVAMAGRRLYVDALAADAPTARARRRLPAVVHPGAGAAVRAGDDGGGAARHGRLQARRCWSRS